jgi:hypothetical protein
MIIGHLQLTRKSTDIRDDFQAARKRCSKKAEQDDLCFLGLAFLAAVVFAVIGLIAVGWPPL